MTGKAATASRPRVWIWTLAITASVYASSPIYRLAGGDSGELLAEACVGGNAHPPGYPLLLLTLRTVRLVSGYVLPQVPFVVVANNLNAAFAVSAAACVTHAVELLVGHGHQLEAITAGLVFAFSELTWEYARGLEVFALNNLLVGLLLVCFVRHVVSNRSKTNLYMGAFLCGLGLTNQHTIVLYEVPMILWIIASTRLGLLDWIYLTTAFAAGLSPYAYTYSVARIPTPGSWGDASTFRGFIAHVLRREYGTFQLSPIRGSSESLHTRLAFYAEDIASELSAIGTLCAIVGVLAALGGAMEKPLCPSPNARVSRHLLVMLAFYLLVFNSLANLPLDAPLPREVTRRFFLQPNILVAILMGLGLTLLRRRCESYIRPSLAYPAFTAVAFALVVHQYLRNRDHFMSAPTAYHDLLRGFGQSILQDLPAKAVLLSYTDVQWNSVRYLQACEDERPDVVHLNLQLMAYPWFHRQHTLYSNINFPPVLRDVSTNTSSHGYAMYLSRFFAANLPSHRLFLDLHGVDESTITSEQLLFGQWQVLPHGFVWRIVQAASSSTTMIDQWRTYATIQETTPPSTQSLLVTCCGLASHTAPLSIRKGSWEYVVASIAHDAMYQRSLAKLSYWLTHGTVTSMVQLEQTVVALEVIQYELNDVVWAGIQFTDGAITYDLYAVEKNAVVGRQRFQLHLEVLAELVAHGRESQPTSKAIQLLLSQRERRREETIAQVVAFLITMESQRDEDADAVRHGLATLSSKRTSIKNPLGESPQQRKKRRKKKTSA